MTTDRDILFERGRRNLSRIGRIITVAAGKGGVGKSVVAASLALTLGERGKNVGLLDLDVHGPSIPDILHARGEIVASKEGLKPLSVHGIKVMSTGMLIGDNPLPTKGEDKRNIISFLVGLTNWGNLDYLIIDLPPGTGDETIWVLRALRGLKNVGVLVVTTPSILAVSVVRRLLSMLEDEKIRVIGIVENMAYFNCEGKVYRPFGRFSEELVRRFKLKVIVSLPIDPSLEQTIYDGGLPHRSSEELKSAFYRLCEVVESSWGE